MKFLVGAEFLPTGNYCCTLKTFDSELVLLFRS